MRTLEIWLDREPIGVLHENQGVWSLVYQDDWIARGYALAPGLPLAAGEIVDTGTRRPVQWFFDNLLPEEAARTRLIDTLPKGNWDAWALLERFGAESAGALTLLPPGVELPPAGRSPITDAELNARILNMPRIPLGSTAPKKMSLAGAQEKLLVVMDETGALYDPIGAQASTHILKPNALSGFYPASAANEWFCARVAQEMKLPVPEVKLIHVPEAAYLIERFDRVSVAGEVRRKHAMDAVQLLNLGAAAKYTESGVDALLALSELCRSPALAKMQLFRWTLFNALIGNGDAHLKNLSVLADKDGYVLAKHYDLVSTASWAIPSDDPHTPQWPHVDLSFPIGNARQFDQLTRADIVEFGNRMSLAAPYLERTIDQFVKQMPVVADRIIEEHERLPLLPEIRAGESRMLGFIRHLPVAEMCGRLLV